MTNPNSPTSLICTDLAIGWLSGFDLTIEMSPIASSANLVRDWNGRLHDWSDPNFRLFSVRITSGEGEMRSPALSQLWPGSTFQIVPPTKLSDTIPAGGTMRTLARDPFPGSLKCVDLNWNDVDFTVDGRTVTLAEPAATPVRIYYRAELAVMVTEPWRESLRESRDSVSWELMCEEVGGMS